MEMSDKDEQSKAKMSAACRGAQWNNIWSSPARSNEQLRAMSWPE
jgi:hypothetical protein